MDELLTGTFVSSIYIQRLRVGEFLVSPQTLEMVQIIRDKGPVSET